MKVSFVGFLIGTPMKIKTEKGHTKINPEKPVSKKAEPLEGLNIGLAGKSNY
ncbi:hypothetical protein [Bacillus sp. FJAT-18017]|uniref:hypothetical protein n=1 Tax=Bacillus sp. FJAT-18017 TaxID=1705566 RepID=UPI000AD3B21D|nr:hypothetical protein [Bacillus sp. FJAT-18017]